MTNTHAVGQMQGYLLQVRYMFYELISTDDITVSIEMLDDVAIESANGAIVLEQIKSVTSNNNPTQNRSNIFWKTLYNWFEYVRNGDITLDKTIFNLVVVSNHLSNVGDIVQSFHDAQDENQARNALHEAKARLSEKKEKI